MPTRLAVRHIDVSLAVQVSDVLEADRCAKRSYGLVRFYLPMVCAITSLDGLNQALHTHVAHLQARADGLKCEARVRAADA